VWDHAYATKSQATWAAVMWVIWKERKREDFLQDEQECGSTDTRSSDKHRTMETYLKHYKEFKQKNVLNIRQT
jgi:hypothetical protein